MKLFKCKAERAKPRRAAMLLQAKQRLPELLRFSVEAHEQISPQIEYLLAVNDGQESGDRLEKITVGVIAAKWLDPCPKELEFLFEVASEARLMAVEFSKAKNAQTH